MGENRLENVEKANPYYTPNSTNKAKLSTVTAADTGI